MISKSLRINDEREPEKKNDKQGPEKKNWPLILLLILGPLVGFFAYWFVLYVGRTDAFASIVASRAGNVTSSEISQLMRQLPLDVWYCAFGIGFWGGLVIVAICIILLKKYDMAAFWGNLLGSGKK
jgi:uncharacterized membrane protein YeaQ/YmgE (transglycosylase-associated protein family)